MRTSPYPIFSAALLAVASVFQLSAQTEYWKADFAGGKFPSGVSVESYTSDAIPSSLYRNIDVAKPWSVVSVNGKYAALSPSHTRLSSPVSNVFTSPYFEVTDADAILRWEGRSILPGFPECYNIYYRVEGQKGINLLYSVEAEEEIWTPRAVSLAKLNGKKIQILFECCSDNKFLLGIADIWAGVPSDVNLSAVDQTKRFVANGDTKEITVSMVSTGATPSDVTLVFTTPDGSVELPPAQWGASSVEIGEWFTVSAPVSFPADAKSDYTVKAKTGGGLITLASGTVRSSRYERTLLIDEGTGMWCNNCPEGILELEKLQHTYGDQVAIIATHAKDVFMQTNYWVNLQWYDIPRMMANRVRANNGATIAKIEPSFDLPTAGNLNVTSIDITGNKAKISGNAEFGFDFDNSNGRYGLGYVITYDFRRYVFEKDYYQENACSMPKFEQYYFLPSKIPSDLAVINHINFDGEYGFNPVPDLLPTSISEGSQYSFSFDIKLPQLAPAWKNCHIVAFILDTETGEVLNATQAPVAQTASSEVALTNHANRVFWSNGKLNCDLNEGSNATVEVYSLAGVLLEKINVAAGQSVALPDSDQPRVVRVTGTDFNEVIKIK